MTVRLGNNTFSYNEKPIASADMNDTFANVGLVIEESAIDTTEYTDSTMGDKVFTLDTTGMGDVVLLGVGIFADLKVDSDGEGLLKAYVDWEGYKELRRDYIDQGDPADHEWAVWLYSNTSYSSSAAYFSTLNNMDFRNSTSLMGGFNNGMITNNNSGGIKVKINLKQSANSSATVYAKNLKVRFYILRYGSVTSNSSNITET